MLTINYFDDLLNSDNDFNNQIKCIIVKYLLAISNLIQSIRQQYYMNWPSWLIWMELQQFVNRNG